MSLYAILWGFFYISGIGISILLLPFGWWRKFWSVVLFPVMGMAIHLIFAGVFIPRGVKLGTSVFYVLITSMLISLIALFVSYFRYRALIKSFRFKTPSFEGIILSLVLAITPMISIFFIESNSVMNVRLGIDAALYADGAQSLLANENVPNIENIATLHPGSLGTALFFQHFRWGSAFLLAISAHATGSFHSLAVAMPLFSLVLFLIAGITLRIIFYRRSFSLPRGLVAVVLTAGNTFFVRLLNEGQWPNLVAILMVSFLIFIILEQHSKFERKWPRIQLSILSIVITCSTLLTYAEILPLLLAIILVGHLAGSICMEKRKFYKPLLTKVIPMASIVFTFFILVNTAHIGYFKTLVLPSYAGVGYPSPRSIFLSDMLGLTNLWKSPNQWLTFGVSVQKLNNPDIAGLSIVSGVLVAVLVSILSKLIKTMRINEQSSLRLAKKRSSPRIIADSKIFLKSSLLIFGLLALLLYSWFSSLVIQKSDYILIKAASILLVPLVIEFLSIDYLSTQRKSKTSKLIILNATILSAVVLNTNINSIYEQRLYSTKLLTGNLVKNWDQASKSQCLYLFNMRGQRDPSLRYVDRTIDYLMESVFRTDVVLDPWTNQSLARPVNAETLENQNVCLALRSDVPGIHLESKFKEIFRDESWLVLNTQMTYKEIVEKFGALENFQTSIFD